MLVSVVIPTWQRAEWLRKGLTALGGQTRLPEEVLVVGRLEDTEAQRVVKEFASSAPFKVEWHEVTDSGHIPPIQAGIAAAGGDIIAFMDDDSEPSPEWLQVFCEVFGDPRVACVGGQIRMAHPPRRVSGDAGRVRWFGEFVQNVGSRTTAGEVDSVGEGNWAWRRDVLATIQIDSQLNVRHGPLYGLDMTLQAKAAGWKVIYDPRAWTYHHEAPRAAELDRKHTTPDFQAYSHNYTYVMLKHLSTPRRFAFLMWSWLVGSRGFYGLVQLVADVVRRRPVQASALRASLRGKVDGFRRYRQSRIPPPISTAR